MLGETCGMFEHATDSFAIKGFESIVLRDCRNHACE